MESTIGNIFISATLLGFAVIVSPKPLKQKIVEESSVIASKLDRVERELNPGCTASTRPLQLSGSSGKIKSQNFNWLSGSNYPDNLNCRWRITVSSGHLVRLKFLRFRTHDVRDHLLVYNGGSASADAKIADMSGNIQWPERLATTRSEMFLVFETDESGTESGFELKWTAEPNACSSSASRPLNLAGSSGTISSHNYPYKYASGLDCQWRITVAEGHLIRAQFYYFDVESGTNAVTCPDYLTVYDGNTTQTRDITGKLCGTRIPDEIQSSGSSLYWTFISDASENDEKGFHATWQAVEDPCSSSSRPAEISTGNRGVIYSHGYPHHYANELNCQWRLTVDPGKVIVLNIVTFDLEAPDENNTCPDAVRIYDGNSSQARALHDAMCGEANNTGVLLRSTHNVMFISFKTNDAVTRDGFKLTWSAENDPCDVRSGVLELKGRNGSLSSKHFPDNYDNNSTCEWVIHPGGGFGVRLTFHSFNVHNDANDGCEDKLNVYDGYASQAVNLTSDLCGHLNKPADVESTGTRMSVVFNSNGIGTERGFNLTWLRVPLACMQSRPLPLVGSNGTITSKDYPARSASNIHCQWRISVDVGETIKVTFQDLSLAEAGACADKLQVYDGASTQSSTIATLCGTSLPGDMESSGNEMLIKLRTFYQDWGTNRRFKLSWRAQTAR